MPLIQRILCVLDPLTFANWAISIGQLAPNATVFRDESLCPRKVCCHSSSPSRVAFEPPKIFQGVFLFAVRPACIVRQQCRRFALSTARFPRAFRSNRYRFFSFHVRRVDRRGRPVSQPCLSYLSLFVNYWNDEPFTITRIATFARFEPALPANAISWTCTRQLRPKPESAASRWAIISCAMNVAVLHWRRKPG